MQCYRVMHELKFPGMSFRKLAHLFHIHFGFFIIYWLWNTIFLIIFFFWFHFFVRGYDLNRCYRFSHLLHWTSEVFVLFFCNFLKFYIHIIFVRNRQRDKRSENYDSFFQHDIVITHCFHCLDTNLAFT